MNIHIPSSESQAPTSKIRTLFENVRKAFQSCFSVPEKNEYIDHEAIREHILNGVYMHRQVPKVCADYVLEHKEELLPEIRGQLAQSLAGESYKIYREMYSDTFQFSSLSDSQKGILVLGEKYSTGFEKDRQKMAQLTGYQTFKNSFDEEGFLGPYVEECLNVVI